MWQREAYGDQCEKCGSTLNTDLINQNRHYRRNNHENDETLVLPLDRYEDFLKEWILVGHKMTGNQMYTVK
jgi:methionyl-tRNA synthetase